MIYFALDAQYDEQKTKDEELGQFLSEINPFLWKEESSADPAYFVEFQKFMKEFRNIFQKYQRKNGLNLQNLI